MAYLVEWPVGDPNHVKTRPEPEGFRVGSGRVGLFKVRVFSGRVPDGLYDFGFFRGSPKQIEKTRSFKLELFDIVHQVFPYYNSVVHKVHF